MTATHGVGTYGNAVGTVTPLDHKMANLSHWVKTAANTIRAGVLWDGNATIVSGKANMSYDVRALTAVLSRGATAGAVELSNDAAYNVPTTAAPGSNSRYDVVYLWQREYSIDGTDSNPVIGVVQGTAAASPTVPSLAAFPGAISLAQILVPAGVTATNSGTTITQTATFTAAAGGAIPFRNTTERDAGTYLESQVGWLIDTDQFIVYTGSAWKTLDQPACSLRKSANQALTTTATAVVWDVEISDPTSMHDNVTNNTRITVAVAGLYEVAVQVYDDNASTSVYATMSLRLNGTTTVAASGIRKTGDPNAGTPITGIVSFVAAVGDYVEVMMNNSTATGNVIGGSTQFVSTVTAKRLGSS